MARSKKPKVRLEDVLVELKETLGYPGGLVHKVEQLCGTVTELSRRVADMRDLIGKVHFPAEAMELLAGELRAIRYLLDPAGEFRKVDALHDAMQRNRDRAGQPAEVKKTP